MMARRCYEFQYGSLTFYRFISFLAALLSYFNTSRSKPRHHTVEMYDYATELLFTSLLSSTCFSFNVVIHFVSRNSVRLFTLKLLHDYCSHLRP